jgi:hypothetical protein
MFAAFSWIRSSGWRHDWLAAALLRLLRAYHVRLILVSVSLHALICEQHLLLFDSVARWLVAVLYASD